MFGSNRRDFLKATGIVTTLPLAASWSDEAQSDFAQNHPEQSIDQIDMEVFPSLKTIRSWHETTAEFLPRPTASPTTHKYMDWLEEQLVSFDGIQTESIEQPVSQDLNRWLEKQASLSLSTRTNKSMNVPIINSVPYTKPTGPDGTTASLVHVPPDTSIESMDVNGKIVVLDQFPQVIRSLTFSMQMHIKLMILKIQCRQNKNTDAIGSH